MNEKVVLAIDPGHSKCGVAHVKRDAEGSIHMLSGEVVPREQVIQAVEQIHKSGGFSMVIVGSGTKSRDIVTALREAIPSVGVLVVDEHNTTNEARARYWEHNPRRGWRKFLPSTLQIPPVPVDDFVALILAERVLLGE